MFSFSDLLGVPIMVVINKSWWNGYRYVGPPPNLVPLVRDLAGDQRIFLNSKH